MGELVPQTNGIAALGQGQDHGTGAQPGKRFRHLTPAADEVMGRHRGSGALAWLHAKRLRLTQSLETIAYGLRADEHKALDDRSFLVGHILSLPPARKLPLVLCAFVVPKTACRIATLARRC